MKAMPSAARSPEPAAGRRRRRLEQLQTENVDLNRQEHEAGRIILASTPQTVRLQIHAPCNAGCVFCSQGDGFESFRLDDWLARFDSSMTPVLQRAATLTFSGSGEVLGLSEAPALLGYLNGRFPHVEKRIATNASYLTHEKCDLIVNSASRYTLQLSLHAPDQSTHELMMRYWSFERVMKNIKQLMEMRQGTDQVRVHFKFVMTTLNADKLPDFVRLAKELGADRVLATYFFICEAAQKYLSLYFKQDLANRAIDEARSVAQEVGMEISLPQKFGEGPAPARTPARCNEPWHQVVVDPEGRILPCDLIGSFKESLADKSFAEIWNGPAYRAIRRSLRAGGGCLGTCQRHNATSINDWEAHVDHRHKCDGQIVQEHHRALRRP